MRISPEQLTELALARARTLAAEGKVDDALGFLEGNHGAARREEGRILLRTLARCALHERQLSLAERVAKLLREVGAEDPLVQERLALARQSWDTPAGVANSEGVSRLLAEAPHQPLDLPMLPQMFVTCLRPYYRRNQTKDPFSELIRLHKTRPLGEILGFLLAEHLRRNTDVPQQVDVVIPVPPDPERFVERGFYPVGEVATWTSRFLRIPYREVLRKVTGTPRSYQATFQELRVAFGLWDGRKAIRLLGGRNVLLIDDVIRIGQTARICVDLLTSVGVAVAFVAALAYVPGYSGPTIWDDLTTFGQAG